jgi:hypothetical protein
VRGSYEGEEERKVLSSFSSPPLRGGDQGEGVENIVLNHPLPNPPPLKGEGTMKRGILY